MDKTLETLVAELEASAPEIRRRAEQAAEEQLVAYRRLIGLDDEEASFIREKLQFKLASEDVPSLLEDIGGHMGRRGFTTLRLRRNLEDYASGLRLQGDEEGALLVEEYEDLFREPFLYYAPCEEDPFGVIVIGLPGECLDDEYFRWGIAAELAHHLVFVLRPEEDIHKGIDEFYDCALSTLVLPSDLKEEWLEDSGLWLKMKHFAACYLERTDNPRKAADMAADAWLSRLKEGYSGSGPHSLREMVEHYVMGTLPFKWYMQLNMRSYFRDISDSLSPEHLTAFSLAWQVLDAIAETTGYSIENSFDQLSIVAARALRDAGVNHLVPAEFVKDVKARLPEYLGTYDE